MTIQTSPKIKLKDTVRWKSSANGTTTEKQGTVIAIVQPFQNPTEKVGRKLERECIFRFDGQVRDHRAYLVRVSRGQGKKDFLYFPRVSSLEVI
jgi:hypothetical protein